MKGTIEEVRWNDSQRRTGFMTELSLGFVE